MGTAVLRGLACLALLAPTANEALASDQLPGIAPLAPAAESAAASVTWYGVTTLLFDDGETRLLIDGFFSRPQFESLDDFATPDTARIESLVASGAIDRVAMVTPVHSHFDHAMDIGAVALATGATVLGSESTANIARGAGVAEERIVVADNRLRRRFGRFEVSLVRSAHAPLVDGGPPIPGSIEQPIEPPARIGDWKEGGSYSIVIAHPAGSALVQGSAGYVADALDGVSVDTVYLGIGGLGSLGKEHAAAYFDEIVGATGAGCVVPIHWDDFTQPFGEIVWRGSIYDVEWLREFAGRQATPPAFATLPFGQAVDAFPRCGS